MATGGERDAVTGAGVGRPAVRTGRLELDRAGEADLTVRAHVGLPGERGRHLAAQEVSALGDLAGSEHGLQLAQRSARDGATERVAREGVAVEEGLPFGKLAEEGRVDLLGRQRRGQREVARGQALREAQEVGHDAFQVGDREGTDATEAGENFVQDQVHAMTAAQGGDRLHEPGGLLHHAGGTLHARLQDDAGSRGGIADQEGLERGQRGGGVGTRDLTGALGVHRGGERLGGEEPGVETTMEFRAATHGHRAERVAVVSAFHRDDPALGFLPDELPILERQLQRDLDGVAAVVREEAPRQRPIGQRRQVLGEPGGHRVVQAEQRHVGDLVELLAQGAVQVGVVMAMHVGPNRSVTV